MPSSKGICCSIHSASGKFEEYADDELPQLTRYINVSGSEGKEFWITVDTEPGFIWPSESFVIDVSVDGVPLRSRPTFTSATRTTSTVIRSNIYVQLSSSGVQETRECPLLFGKLDLLAGDQDGINDEKAKDVKSLGEIRICFLRAQYLGADVYTGSTGTLEQKRMKIAEKAMKGKAISHGIQFGESKVVLNQTWARMDKFDTITNPYLEFRFLYRSRETLESLGLIQPPPPQLVSTEEQILATKSPEEMAREIARLKALLEGNSGGSSTQAKPGLKREQRGVKREASTFPSSSSSSSRRLRATEEIEVLDLTGDD